MTMVYMLVMTDGIYLYSCFFFFLMIRRPPRSTLFPTRRSSDLHAGGAAGEAPGPRGAGGELRPGRRSLCEGTRRRVRLPLRLRSEEHTSELQSQSNLVCRLLLEKKKTKYNRCIHYCMRSSTQVS